MEPRQSFYYILKSILRYIKPLRSPRKASKKLLWDEMTPETKILNSGFSLNNEVRKFFKHYLGFVKDFFNDENSKKFSSKMKVASILWNNAKQSSNKKYDSSLIEKYKDKIQNYMI